MYLTSFGVAASINPASDHEIVIEDATQNQIKLTYSAQTKSVTSDETSIQVVAAPLFSDVEISRYTKEGKEVTFDATLTFDGALLW